MMTAADIRSTVCAWIDSLGYKAVQAYQNTPAPHGLHIAVSVQGVRPYGSLMKRGVKGKGKANAMQYVATVQLYEVEGEGDALRRIRTSLETDDFATFVAARFPDTENGEARFSVWEVGEIQDNSSQDGIYFIKQKTMTFDVQFNDFIENKTERIMSVNGEIENDPFKVEVQDG